MASSSLSDIEVKLTAVDIGKPSVTGQIDDLLLANKVEIDALRELVKDVLPAQWDDIWLLRYVLSNGDAKSSEDSVRFAVKWREANKAVLASVAAGNPPPNAEICRKFQVTGSHKTAKNGAPFFVVRAGLSNMTGLMDAATHEQVVDWLIFQREAEFMAVDRLARVERRLVKTLGVIDMRNLRFSSDRRFFKCLGESSKLSEKLYPQLVGRSAMINTPSFFKVLLTIMKATMSKRMTDKMSVCPADTLKGDITKCPFFAMNFNPEDIPTFLGGKCNCPGGGCINGVPNSQRVPIAGISGDGKIILQVKYSSKEVAELVVDEGSLVRYSFVVEKNDISIEAGVYSLDEESVEEPVSLLALTKASAGEEISGTWKAPRAGVLKFTFDNKASYMTSKKVTYSLEIVEAADAS